MEGIVIRIMLILRHMFCRIAGTPRAAAAITTEGYSRRCCCSHAGSMQPGVSAADYASFTLLRLAFAGFGGVAATSG